MKKQTNRLCVLIGICLLIVAALVLIFWQWKIHDSQQKASKYLQTIRTLIPEPQNAALEEKHDNAMPVLDVSGKDFIGILEMPKFRSSLPVCADWGKVSEYPCRLGGNVYDRTIQIGATSQKGQYDFYREISVGDTVVFTDMEGNRFTYEITALKYEKHASRDALGSEEADLTLFIKNIYSFEYIVYEVLGIGEIVLTYVVAFGIFLVELLYEPISNAVG